jgi:hypothetical protein
MSGYHKRDWETFPMHKIKRVDRPTTLIRDDKVQRVREREAGFCKAAAGDYGPVLQREFKRFVPKHPLSGALSWMRNAMRSLVDGMVAAQKAPIPTDPAALSRHVKETAYFLRADAVGICELPHYAVYSHKFDFMKPEAGETPIELNHKYAIGILVDQDCRTSSAYTGSDWISNAMSMMSYATQGLLPLSSLITSGDSAILPRLTMPHFTTLMSPLSSSWQGSVK